MSRHTAKHARAVLEGRTVGDVVNEALRLYLKRTVMPGKRSLVELRPEPFPEGNGELSREIDDVVYGPHT
jgi:hypothetical protein